MMHLFINALAASSGGGITYIRNVVCELEQRADVAATVVVSPALQCQLQSGSRVRLLEVKAPAGAAQRFLFEQRHLPQLIRSSGARVLLSAGNFALWTSPVPQILLSRNALYTSSDFARDLRRRRKYGMLMETKLKGAVAAASIRRADVTVAPSQSFADELRHWTGSNVLCVYHGFDDRLFRASDPNGSADLQQKLANPTRALRLLFVSHYNYYRNFETLLRSLPVIKRLIPDRPVQLVLTCQLHSNQASGGYRSDSAAGVVRQLGIADNLLELGAIPYSSLHHVYRACDIYVTSAYSESFAHPLVEAMSSGLPIVASDLAVHREICGDAAVYFARFSPEALAEQVARLVANAVATQELRERARARSQDFSWSRHVEALLNIAQQVADTSRSTNHWKSQL